MCSHHTFASWLKCSATPQRSFPATPRCRAKFFLWLQYVAAFKHVHDVERPGGKVIVVHYGTNAFSVFSNFFLLVVLCAQQPRETIFRFHEFSFSLPCPNAYSRLSAALNCHDGVVFARAQVHQQRLVKARRSLCAPG